MHTRRMYSICATYSVKSICVLAVTGDRTILDLCLHGCTFCAQTSIESFIQSLVKSRLGEVLHFPLYCMSSVHSGTFVCKHFQ